MALNKESLAGKKQKLVEHRIESLSDSMYFRPLSALDRLKIFALFQKAETEVDQARVCYSIVHLCAVEESGALLFSSGDEVGEFDDDVTQELVKVVMEINGFTNTAVETEAKN